MVKIRGEHAMIDSLNRYEKLFGGKYLTAGAAVRTENRVLRGVVEGAAGTGPDSYGAVEFVEGIPERISKLVDKTFGGVYREDPEGYVILLDDDITIYARGLRGYVYAAYDLQRMSAGGFLRQGILYNAPLAKIRSLKLYLPPEKNIEPFKRVIDMCCRYRVNTLIVEVGGAMEYRRHPEINEGWAAYCAEMHEYSGKTTVIQEQTFPWGKNSIHCENGGGKRLTQAQVRDIVDYCVERGIDVVPEMPTLSHCDYLLTRHPEFAERRDDPYPDTYCPNAPGIYGYVFDVLDEVVDVFRPKAMHIGHDEYYSVCLCERCRGLDAAEVYARDIIKIHDHLASKGVRTIIWSEKLLNAVTRDGHPAGGAEKPYYFKGEKVMTIPATYRAINMVPKDILCMHWYWGILREWDNEFLSRGFGMFFGNFQPLAMPEAAARLAAGVLGGGPSNWSYAMLPYLQENGVLTSLAYASLLFWKDGMTDDRYTECLEYCFKDLFMLGNGEALKRPHLEILHATTHSRPFRYLADGVFKDYGADTIGKYVVEYEDGTSFEVPVIYGQNIADRNRFWNRGFPGEDFPRTAEDEDDAGDYDSYMIDALLAGMAYSTLPERTGGETWFRIAVENPHPEKKVKGVRAVEAPGMEGRLIVKSMEWK
jgi:hexosaminidase